MRIPRIIITGLSGGAGKTMVSLGLSRAFCRRGISLRSFKKGPDYIDAAWLALAARAPQGNLDPFFTPGEALLGHFSRLADGYDLTLIEGNRGIFDGLDLAGSCSSAEVSRILRAPLILVLDCTKMTRTAAALVKGCIDFEPNVNIGGVVLNRTGNSRHQNMVRSAVEDLCGLPVLGVLPRKADGLLAERHMGLAGMDECAEADAHLDKVADFISDHLDLEAVLRLARSAPDLPDPTPRQDASCTAPAPRPAAPTGTRPRIGYVYDAAFWFYYQENLDALRAAGAELLPVSLLDATPWPELDGLYIGGGLPELHAEALSANKKKRSLVAALSRAGLPIYAECGGFMYLSDCLVIEGKSYPMAGVFPCAVEFCSRPQGLGYVSAEVVRGSPFHPAGLAFRGHEFHFSRCTAGPSKEQTHQFRLRRGSGMAAAPDGSGLDGLLQDRTFASYTHIYAPALPHWATSFITLCLKRNSGQASRPDTL